jgi:hypothetical protein
LSRNFFGEGEKRINREPLYSNGVLFLQNKAYYVGYAGLEESIAFFRKIIREAMSEEIKIFPLSSKIDLERGFLSPWDWALKNIIQKVPEEDLNVFRRTLNQKGANHYSIKLKSVRRFASLGVKQKIQAILRAANKDVGRHDGIYCASFPLGNGNAYSGRFEHFAVIIPVADGHHLFIAQFFYILLFLNSMVGACQDMNSTVNFFEFLPAPAESIGGETVDFQKTGDVI